MTRLGALTPVILSLALSAGTAFAQATTGFGSAQDVKLPVEVTADQLSVDQKTGKATFSGKVLVGQGAMRLSADSVTVTYAAGGQQRISALLAEGNVTMVSGPDAAEAKQAIYDVASGNVTLIGDVLLTQGQNVMSGEHMVVNLSDGTAQMQGRVRSVLQPAGQQ